MELLNLYIRKYVCVCCLLFKLVWHGERKKGDWRVVRS